MNHHLTLVLGGVASGKSAYGEALAESLGSRRLYLATAEAFDQEMADKVRVHQARRGAGWITHEVPMDPASALADVGDGDVVLLDCATMWLSNLMFADADLVAETRRLIEAAASCTVPVIVVSNEVGLGGVRADALARRFANAQGRLNQALAGAADRVVLVTAGLPMTLKGD